VITDGLSNTMALAEIIVAPTNPVLGRAVANDTTSPLNCRARLVNGVYTSESSIIAQFRCHGQRWQDGRPQYCGVTNILPPNSATCSSQAGTGIYTSASRHPGGVNVLLADGRVRFIKDSINLFVWQAQSPTRGRTSASTGESPSPWRSPTARSASTARGSRRARPNGCAAQPLASAESSSPCLNGVLESIIIRVSVREHKGRLITKGVWPA
jgi:prepilin-type processing-associated H-X9-DG protein